MKETILEALMQLFKEIDISEQQAYPEMLTTLENAGFKLTDIQKALIWLQSFADLAENQIKPVLTTPSIRIYSPDERSRLGLKGQSFLRYLENIRVINSRTREMIIDRLMLLDSQELKITQIRWIALMVLANQNQSLPSIAWLNCIIAHPKNEITTCH